MIQKRGAIEVYFDNDKRLTGELNIPDARNTFRKNKEQCNQLEVDPRGCAYHAGFLSLLDNLPGKLSPEEIQNGLEELESMKYEYGYQDGEGMYLYKAADMVVDRWNEHNDNDPIQKYRIEMGAPKFREAIEKGYSIHTGYRTSDEYSEDKSDGELDEHEFGSFTGGHSIRDSIISNYIYRIDNYYEGQPIKEDDNVYKIQKETYKKLLDDDTSFTYGYIYIFTKDIMTQHEKDIAMIEYALEEGLTNNPQNLEDIKNKNYTTDVKNILIAARNRKDIMDKISVLESNYNNG